LPLRIGNKLLGYHPPSRTPYIVDLPPDAMPIELARTSAGPDLTEVGAIQTKWDAEFESNPDDLVRKVGLRTYEKMLTYPTVKAGSRLTALGIVGPGWEVTAAMSGERAAQEMADAVDWNFRELPGAFKNVELGILTGRDYGFSLSALKWGIIEDGPWAGKWGIMDVKTKPPFSYGFKRDTFGNLEAITHLPITGDLEEFTNLKKWVIYAHDVGSVFGSPFGRSQLRPAYDYWKALLLVFRMRGVFVERTASGIPVIKYKRGLRPGERARYEKMIKKLQTAAGLAVPDDVMLEWAEKKGDSHEEFERFTVYCETTILRSMLVPSQVGIGPETQVGSQAKARIHRQIYEWVMDDGDSDLTAAVNEQIVRRFCDNNFPNAAQIGYPTWKHKERSSDDAIKLVAAYGKLIEGKGLGEIQLDDVNTARRRLGHPEISQKEWDEQKAAGVAQPTEIKKAFAPDEAGDDDTIKEKDDSKTAVAVDGTKTAGDKEKIVQLASADPFVFARHQPFVRETLHRATKAGQHDNANYLRELTAPEREQGIRPKEYAKRIDKIEEAGSREVTSAFSLVREKLIPQLERKGLLDGSASMADLWGYGGLNGTAKKNLTDGLHRTLLTGYVNGALTAKAELEKGLGRSLEFEIFGGIPVMEFAELRPEFLIEPNEAREFWSKLIPLPKDIALGYKAEAFWITGLYLDDHGELLRQVKEVIRQGYRHGNWNAVESSINRLFEEWIGAGRVVAEGQIFTPWHTHVIVRNATMRSYNAGRYETFKQAREWIEAYQWASIIDERTTDFCDGMDGLVFAPGQVEWPPAHHQCRSIVVAVLRGMSYKMADQEVLSRFGGMRDAQFTSGVMGAL